MSYTGLEVGLETLYWLTRNCYQVSNEYYNRSEYTNNNGFINVHAHVLYGCHACSGGAYHAPPMDAEIDSDPQFSFLTGKMLPVMVDEVSTGNNDKSIATKGSGDVLLHSQSSGGKKTIKEASTFICTAHRVLFKE